MADSVRIAVFATSPLSLAARHYGAGEIVVERAESIRGESFVRLRLVSADGIEFAAATLSADQWDQLVEAGAIQ